MRSNGSVKYQQFLSIFFFAGLFLLLYACTTSVIKPEISPTSHATNANIDEPTVIIEFVTNPSFVVHSSLPEKAWKSDLIIIGEVISSEGIVNTSRDTQDVTKSSSEVFGIGEVYKIKIHKYIKGDGPGIIYLAQGQGAISLSAIDYRAPSLREINASRKANEGRTYVPFTLDKPYLMFIKKHDYDYKINGYNSKDIHFGVYPPWRYDISDPKCAVPESPIEVQGFPPQPLSVILREIRKKFDPSNPEASAPDPENIITCQPETRYDPLPYPNPPYP
ncbi:MAG: hypothetical protein U9R58_03105 [Chloroflexota bacterium]|nr:hypothetical protein [Chloroflexota bacterium]